MITQRDNMQGVLQWTVLGPLLWNILYDSILNISLGEGTRIVAYALFVEAENLEALNDMVNDSLHRIHMVRHELQITEHKTKAIILKGARKRVDINFNLIDTQIITSKSAK